MTYWEQERTKKPGIFRQLRVGLPIGVGLGILIVLNFWSGWYKRATMVANSQSTPMVLLVAIVIIIVFWSIFAQRHKRDMNEQRYMELLVKKNKEVDPAGMQQDLGNKSHIE
ncbi:hypothetical protein [Segetibacter sp. 3557_3]|uniref:hypothetical protein n=1 Tax=Segetibacter sp. 3557_3 TaxID=2547429 RepID=UPI001A9EC72A|nr:hypothetical protein [Segetibacter sp. 3557_3]